MKALARTLFVFLAVALPLSAQTPTAVTCPTGLVAGGPPGVATVTVFCAAAKGPTALGVVCPATTATFSSSNTGVATVPASQLVPANATTFTFPVTPVGPGTTTIFVTMNATTTNCDTAVAAAPGPVAAAGAPTLSPAAILLMAVLLLGVGTIVIRRW